jgi:hypothetical protein
MRSVKVKKTRVIIVTGIKDYMTKIDCGAAPPKISVKAA